MITNLKCKRYQMTKLMNGKKGIVFGLSNTSGIAYAISRALHNEGAELAFSYLPIMEKRVKSICEEFGSDIMLPGNVQDSESLDEFFKEIEKRWGKIDFMLHSVAFSNKDELRGQYIDTTRENFKNTLDVSCFSFTDLCKRSSKIMNENSACLTLSYFGGEKFIPNYNIMGIAKAALDCSVKYLAHDLGKKKIRVNSLSAGPIKTLAASGIGGFSFMEKWSELNSPLNRNVTLEDLGKSGLYLLSDLSSGVTGEVHHVDCGYNSIGMMDIDNMESVSNLLNKSIK